MPHAQLCPSVRQKQRRCFGSRRRGKNRAQPSSNPGPNLTQPCSPALRPHPVERRHPLCGQHILCDDHGECCVYCLISHESWVVTCVRGEGWYCSRHCRGARLPWQAARIPPGMPARHAQRQKWPLCQSLILTNSPLPVACCSQMTTVGVSTACPACFHSKIMQRHGPHKPAPAVCWRGRPGAGAALCCAAPSCAFLPSPDATDFSPCCHCLLVTASSAAGMHAHAASVPCAPTSHPPLTPKPRHITHPPTNPPTIAALLAPAPTPRAVDDPHMPVSQ